MVRYKEILEDSRKGDVINLCSLRATRKILRYYWYWDIPESTIEESRVFFNKVLKGLADGIIKAHVRNNDTKVKYHLKPKLRLSIDKYFLDEVLKRIVDVNMGATGEINKNTVVSDKQDIEVV